MRRSLALILLTLLLGACPKAKTAPVTTGDAPPKGRQDGGTDVTLTTKDGVKLAATHWAGAAGNEKCVVFVHQLASTRDEWLPLIERLRGRSELLALDLRGHGGSTRGPNGELAWKAFDDAEWVAAVNDVYAAQAWLKERGFTVTDCVYVGASIGSSLVVRFAGDRWDVGGLVLLSPGMAYRGLDIRAAAAEFNKAVLVVHSEEDGAKETADQLAAIWGDDDFQLIEVAGTTHGISTIADDPALLDAVVLFIEGALAGSEHPDAAPPPDQAVDE